MTVLDASAYESFLELARRGLITFKWDPNKHPRDHNGRWKSIPDMKDGKLGSVMDRETQGLPDNTQDMHTWRNPKHGHRWEYTPERQKLHEAIVEAYLAGKKPADGTPTMLFTAGGAGSGKSYALEQLDIEPPDAVLIDPDDIKVLIPEYEKLAAEGDFRAMHLVHDESIDIAEKLRARVVEDRYNATMDGTGASPQFRDRVGAALDAGYEVKVDYFNTDVATAMKRIEDRKKTTGRAVNKWVAWDMHRNASRIFHDVFEEGVQVRVWDTTAEGKPPTLAMEAEAGAEPEVHDQDAFDSFLKKADAKPAWELQQIEKRRKEREARLPKGTNASWSLKPEAKKLKGTHGMSKGDIEGEWNLPELYMADESLAGAYASGGQKPGRVVEVEYAASKVLVIDSGAKMQALWTRTGIEEATAGQSFHPTTTHTVAEWARVMGYDAIEITPEGVGAGDGQDEDDVELGFTYGAGTFGEPQTILLYPQRATIDGKKPKPPKPPKQVPKARNPKQGALPGFGSAPVLRLEKGARVDSPAGKGEIVKVTGVIVQVLVDGEKKPRRYEVKDLRGV